MSRQCRVAPSLVRLTALITGLEVNALILSRASARCCSDDTVRTRQRRDLRKPQVCGFKQFKVGGLCALASAIGNHHVQVRPRYGLVVR
jgi:hypothetical protein